MPLIRPHDSVVCTVLDDGGVLLHLETKYYYSLNRTGLAYWTLLEQGHADPAAAFAERFPEAGDRAEALATFRTALDAESLVVEDPGTPTATDPGLDIGDDATWEPPQLTRHDVPLNQIMSNPFDPAVPLAE